MDGRQRHYSILIEWEPQGHIYVARVLELPGCMSYGVTYEDALSHIQEALDGFIEVAENLALSLPSPQVYDLNEVTV